MSEVLRRPTGTTGRPHADGRRSQRYLTNYGLGLAMVALAVSIANFASAIGGNPAGLPANAVCLVIYLAAVAASVVRELRGTRWRRLTWIWLAAILTGTAVLRFSLPAQDLLLAADWSIGAFGFVAVVVLIGRPLAVLAVSAVVNCLIGLPLLIESGLYDQQRLVQYAATAVAVSVFPLAAAVFYPQLAGVSVAVDRDNAVRRELVARELASRQVAADRAHRAGAIEATAAPLLRALADGTADPQDPLVRTAARIESARMRRLFAEVDEVDEPMLHEVRASIDAVERLGVTVSLETRGSLPPLPLALRRALLEAPMSTLASAVTTARVVIVSGPQSLSVSVVTDGPPGPERPSEVTERTRTATMVVDDKTWTRTSWESTT